MESTEQNKLMNKIGTDLWLLEGKGEGVRELGEKGEGIKITKQTNKNTNKKAS